MPKQQNYDHLIKLLIVGDSGIGKTNILLRFCEDNFLNSHLTTIGIDFKTKTVDVDGKKIRMQIWDTAGQQRFKTITQTYFRGAMGIFLTYAVNDIGSFNGITNWLKQIKTYAGSDVVVILVGNKCDSKREVSFQQGQKLATEIGVPFYETSAKNNTGITECFMAMAKIVKAKLLTENQISYISYTGSKLHKSADDHESRRRKNCC